MQNLQLELKSTEIYDDSTIQVADDSDCQLWTQLGSQNVDSFHMVTGFLQMQAFQEAESRNARSLKCHVRISIRSFLHCSLSQKNHKHQQIFGSSVY